MTHSEDGQLVTIEDISEASIRIAGVAFRTPLVPFRDGVWLKPESLQPTGSFKIRGAYNTLAQLSADERGRGVVTHSSGNHAQAIARAARLLGIRAVVVMPDNAPAVKVAGVRADGAEIVFVGPLNTERVARAHEIAKRDGMVLVSSANDVRVIAGQGTIGLEIVEQILEMRMAVWPDVGEPPIVLVPAGLGGLSAGVATAIKGLPAWAGKTGRVFAIEPEIAADTRASLAARTLTPWPPEETAKTIADGLRAEAPAPIPFRHQMAHLDGVLTVTENEIVMAVGVAAREARLVLEPSGATSLAGLLFRENELPPGPKVVVLSGGNVDPARYLELLAAAPA